MSRSMGSHPILLVLASRRAHQPPTHDSVARTRGGTAAVCFFDLFCCLDFFFFFYNNAIIFIIFIYGWWYNKYFFITKIEWYKVIRIRRYCWILSHKKDGYWMVTNLDLGCLGTSGAGYLVHINFIVFNICLHPHANYCHWLLFVSSPLVYIYFTNTDHSPRDSLLNVSY